MSQNPSTLQSFFAELKRRRVFRVMAVYGATAFVLLQVADLLAEGMGLSDQVLRITTFIVLIGFPIAVVLAWAFETTPEGVKRTTDAAPARDLCHHRAARLESAGPPDCWLSPGWRCCSGAAGGWGTAVPITRQTSSYRRHRRPSSRRWRCFHSKT